jgi:hypothetical protein
MERGGCTGERRARMATRGREWVKGGMQGREGARTDKARARMSVEEARTTDKGVRTVGERGVHGFGEHVQQGEEGGGERMGMGAWTGREGAYMVLEAGGCGRHRQQHAWQREGAHCCGDGRARW